MIEDLTSEIINARAGVYNYVIILIWALYVVGNPLLTSIFKSNKTDWGNYWTVWFFTSLISGIVLAFALTSPEQVLEWVIKFKGTFLN